MSTSLSWHWQTAALLPMVAGSVIYGAGVLRLWRSAGHGRGVGRGAVLAFACGMALLAVALLSPLAALADHLFSAHMVVHELIMAAAAPLFILARTRAAMAWSLPVWLLRLLKPLKGLAGELQATLLQAAVIWAWHVPALFRAATENEALHMLQHFSFFLAALLFWQAMEGLNGPRAGKAVACLFGTSMHTGFLGALLLLSPRLWFPATGSLGLSALEDQQLGGAIMWMPGGLVYAAAALWAAQRWIGSRRQPLRPDSGVAGRVTFPEMGDVAPASSSRRGLVRSGKANK